MNTLELFKLLFPLMKQNKYRFDVMLQYVFSNQKSHALMTISEYATSLNMESDFYEWKQSIQFDGGNSFHTPKYQITTSAGCSGSYGLRGTSLHAYLNITPLIEFDWTKIRTKIAKADAKLMTRQEQILNKEGGDGKNRRPKYLLLSKKRQELRELLNTLTS